MKMISSKEYYFKNKEKIKLIMKKSYMKHKDKCLKYSREYYNENKDYYLKYSRNYHKINRDKILKEMKLRNKINKKRYLELSRIYHEKHRMKYRIIQTKWRKNNPEKFKLQLLRRKGKLKGIFHDFNDKQWIILKKSVNGYCLSCTGFVGENNLTLDHIIPISRVSKGFVYTIHDVRPICRSCNSSKGNKLIHS